MIPIQLRYFCFTRSGLGCYSTDGLDGVYIEFGFVGGTWFDLFICYDATARWGRCWVLYIERKGVFAVPF